MATAADVPGKYDLVLNVAGVTNGYTFLRTLDGSYLSASRHRAEYTSTPTFLERQNVSGAYGDDQQAFFMTASQKDWSRGEGQTYFRQGDPDSARGFYKSSCVDVATVPGRVLPRADVVNITPAGQSYAGCAAPLALAAAFHYYVSIDAGTPTLHQVDANGSDTSKGATGSGTPSTWGMCNDNVNVYIAGGTTIRRWNGTAFSNFGAANANAGALAFLNNALYSCDGSALKTYDGTGVATTLFTWKDATNTALTTLQNPKIVPFGGKLLIFFPHMADGPELWIYDGTGAAKLAALSDSVIGFDITVLDGVVFMSGVTFGTTRAGVATGIPIIYYWNSGTIGELWRDPDGSYQSPYLNAYDAPALGTLSGRLVWAQNSGVNSGGAATIREYDPGTGAITVAASIPKTGTTVYVDFPRISSGPVSVVAALDRGTTGGGSTVVFWPGTAAPTAFIVSSLFDFDSNLTKTFRSVKVETQDAASGFDIYYSVDTLTTFTLLQAAGVSGTEYTLPGSTSGRAIAVKIVLNGTILQRYYIRAVPRLSALKVRTYNLDLSSTQEHTTVLEDGSPQPLSGFEQAQNLQAAISSTSPLSITDKFGTFTGVCEPSNCSILELHSGGSSKAKPGQYVAQITVREV